MANTIILSISNNNPVVQANESKFKTNVGEYNSELLISLTNEYFINPLLDLSTFNKGTWDGGDIENTIKQYIPSITVADGTKFEIQAGKLVYVGTNETEENWLINMNIVNATVTSTGLGVDAIAETNSTVNGEIATYMDPIIPVGFKAINDGTVWPTDWDKGLVIEDESGNQFVWVPVNGTTVQYVKWGIDSTTDAFPTDISNETSQITKYGGFYIARYEAGNESNILVSKKDAPVLD